MNAAQDRTPAAGSGMARIIGDCERLGLVTGEGGLTALRRLESALGEELADRLVGALSTARRTRGLF